MSAIFHKPNYELKKSKTRICPDCGVRELEYKCQFCSDCAESREYFSKLLSDKKWRDNNPEKYKETKKKYYDSNTEKCKKWSRDYQENNKERVAKYKKIHNRKYYLEITKPRNEAKRMV